MKFHRPVLSLLMLACMVPSKAFAEDVAAKPLMVELFNGTNLTGWTLFTTNQVTTDTFCTVSNGVISLKGKPHGYLATEKSYANYHLHLQWRWTAESPKNNSGVFVDLVESNAIWPDCVQCQVKVGQTGDLLGMGAIHLDAPLINGKSLIKNENVNERPSGEWNDYDIVCNSNRVETTVNGKPGASGTCNASKGRIALQSEGSAIEFRDFKLVPLSASVQK